MRLFKKRRRNLRKQQKKVTAPADLEVLIPQALVAQYRQIVQFGSYFGIVPWTWPDQSEVPRSSAKPWSQWLFRAHVTMLLAFFATTSAQVLHRLLWMKLSLFQLVLETFAWIVVAAAVAMYEPLFRKPGMYLTFVQMMLGFYGNYQRTNTIQGAKPLKSLEFTLNAARLSLPLVTLDMSMLLVILWIRPSLPFAVTGFIPAEIRLSGSYWPLFRALDLATLTWVGWIATSVIVLHMVSGLVYNVVGFEVLRDVVTRNAKFTSDRARQPLQMICNYKCFEILSIYLNEACSTFFATCQMAMVSISVVSVYAGIRFGGLAGIGLGLMGLCVLMLTTIAYSVCATIGETSNKTLDKLARQCVGDAYLRRRARALRPLWIRVGSLYFIDKQCVTTMCSVAIDGLVNALLLSR